MEVLTSGARFSWPQRGVEFIDCEPNLTISDIWGAVSWVWTWPGDWILSQEPMRTFFEIEGGSAVGTLASTLFGWFVLFTVFFILASIQMAFDILLSTFRR